MRILRTAAHSRFATLWTAALACAALLSAPAATQPVAITVPLSVPVPLWGLPASALPTANPLAQDVRDASLRFGIPERWIYAVMRAESAGRVSATSRVGAMGLMQIMPATWGALSARYALGSDAYAPRANIIGGTAYLREMYDRFGAPGFLAAYNAGPARYQNHLSTGRPLPRETQHYVAKIAPAIGYAIAPALSPALLPASVRAVQALRVATTLPVATPWTQAALFVAHSARINTPLGAPVAAPVTRVIARAQAPSHAPQKPPINGLFALRSGALQ